MKKNGFLTFCFSLIPGAGQMYQGYMKRGCSLMILFVAFWALTAISSTPLLAIPIPIIFAYCFFDTFNIRNRNKSGNNSNSEIQDEYIWSNYIKNTNIGELRGSTKLKYIGWALIILGIYLVINTILKQIAYQYDLYFLVNMINVFVKYASTILIAGVAIGVGIKFVVKK